MPKPSEVDAFLMSMQARDYPPNHKTWGMLLSEDVEFDLGAFHWFRSRAEMLEYIWKYLPCLDPYDSDAAMSRGERPRPIDAADLDEFYEFLLEYGD